MVIDEGVGQFVDAFVAEAFGAQDRPYVLGELAGDITLGGVFHEHSSLSCRAHILARPGELPALGLIPGHLTATSNASYKTVPHSSVGVPGGRRRAPPYSVCWF